MRYLFLFATAAAWYLPGLAPTDYKEGDEVPVLVNRLTSTDAESSGGGGIDYYSPHLRFCEPEDGRQKKGGSLGSVLFGDRLYTSPFTPRMLLDEDCHIVCSTVYSSADAEYFTNKVIRGYMQHWLVDGLPVLGLGDEDSPNEDGFPLGEVVPEENSQLDEVIVYNHFDLELSYHYNPAAMSYRVVGASIRPKSIGGGHDREEGEPRCQQTDPQDVLVMRSDTVGEVPVTFSYSVRWRSSDTPWATRWDRYLTVREPVVNWFALVNTTTLVFSLCFVCGLLLTRMLRKDIAQYNAVDLNSEDIPIEAGWKLISGDVFRPPGGVQALAIATGTGAQLLVTLLVTVTLAALGLLSPANRGSFSTALLLLNTLLGGIGGYISAVTYKAWRGTKWKTNLLMTPVFLPCVVFLLFVVTNTLLVFHDASGAVPFQSVVVLVLIWGLISVPLSFVAGFFGFRKALPVEQPTRVNQIPRQVPPQPWYLKSIPLMLISGLVPYLAVSLQLRYILSAIWFQSIYYMFGFLFASMWAMVLLSVASCFMALYFTLVHEDYRWQWRSFSVAGSPAIYVWAYSLYYMTSRLSLHNFTGIFLYVAYTSLASAMLFLALGSVGTLASYLLVCKIYQSIKMD